MKHIEMFVKLYYKFYKLKKRPKTIDYEQTFPNRSRQIEWKKKFVCLGVKMFCIISLKTQLTICVFSQVFGFAHHFGCKQSLKQLLDPLLTHLSNIIFSYLSKKSHKHMTVRVSTHILI